MDGSASRVDERLAAGAAGEAERVIDRLASRPGGTELLELASERAGVALVGGSVRDLLDESRIPRELDVVVDHGAQKLAAELAARLPGNEARMPETTEHERFGTASVKWIYGRIDIAERRAESYPHPGALPDVRPGTIGEDLARRDFTVNAMMVPLGRPQRRELVAVEHALDDLSARRLRVLHKRSFIDDPTRLLRLARYSARLGFEIEARTARLAHEAIAAGALATVSGARIAAELWLVTEEPTTEAFMILGELGVLEALSLPTPFDMALLDDARQLMPPDGVADIVEMGVLFHPAREPSSEERRAAAQLMEDFEFFAGTRAAVLAGAFDSFALAAEIESARKPSQLRAALAGTRVEAVAIAAALGARRNPEIAKRARRWLDELRGVKLQITGADLLAAGVAEGPEIGRRLRHALDQKLDGEIAAGRDAELQAALEAQT